MAELGRLGEQVVPPLRSELTKEPALDLRQRLEKLVALGEGPLTGERLREVRAVEVLERIGTAEVRALLEKLAKGADAVPLTRDARAAHARLAARDGP